MKSSNDFQILIVLFVGFIWLFSSCSSKTPLAQLKEDINNELSKVEGEFGIAFKDLTTGETLFINEKEVFHAASTMKTPVMIEVFKQAQAGHLSLADSILIKNDFKSIVDSTHYSLNAEEDSESMLYHQVGTMKPLSAIVYDMINMSSNLATNIVIELVDAKNVTLTMHDLGANDLLVLRGVEDSKAFTAGLNNTTTAYDLMMIFEKLAKGKAVSPEADQQMIDILLDQKFNEIIPAQLPANVKVAHKTGTITGVQHDSGIVMLPDGKEYVLVTLSKNLTDSEKGVAAMANVSELIYKHVVGH
ncbi:MAG TPA: serine hydrolase [Cytophagales bacterium]|nr:serine hydrolase [Cytophagales bacterium]